MTKNSNTNTSGNNSSSKADSNGSSSSETDSNSGGDRSNNSYYAPFGNWAKFMHSYGLKPWDVDDVAEGRAILEGMKTLDREADDNKE